MPVARRVVAELPESAGVEDTSTFWNTLLNCSVGSGTGFPLDSSIAQLSAIVEYGDQGCHGHALLEATKLSTLRDKRRAMAPPVALVIVASIVTSAAVAYTVKEVRREAVLRHSIIAI